MRKGGGGEGRKREKKKKKIPCSSSFLALEDLSHEPNSGIRKTGEKERKKKKKEKKKKKKIFGDVDFTEPCSTR